MKNLILAITLTSAGLCACSSTGYSDPGTTEELNLEYGRTDLQTFAGEMVKSLIAAPQLSYLMDPVKGDDQRIRIAMGGVNNRTSEHIDTQGITDSMKVKLLNSGKFRIMTSQQGQDEIGDQVRFQQGSGRFDPAHAQAFGKQLSAEVVLYGNLRSIEKKKGASIESLGVTKRDKYFQFVLDAVNVETGELLWSEEVELSKDSRTGLFGR
jgi:hypothetical protein